MKKNKYKPSVVKTVYAKGIYLPETSESSEKPDSLPLEKKDVRPPEMKKQ